MTLEEFRKHLQEMDAVLGLKEGVQMFDCAAIKQPGKNTFGFVFDALTSTEVQFFENGRVKEVFEGNHDQPLWHDSVFQWKFESVARNHALTCDVWNSTPSRASFDQHCKEVIEALEEDWKQFHQVDETSGGDQPGEDWFAYLFARDKSSEHADFHAVHHEDGNIEVIIMGAHYDESFKQPNLSIEAFDGIVNLCG